jgi:hypothetical protein
MVCDCVQRPGYGNGGAALLLSIFRDGGTGPYRDAHRRRRISWLARVAVLQGKVELTLAISAQGAVTKILEVSGAEPLALAAKTALTKWHFAGCQRGCDMKFVALFVLDGSCSAGENCPSTFEFDAPSKITVKSKSIRAIVN